MSTLAFPSGTDFFSFLTPAQPQPQPRPAEEPARAERTHDLIREARRADNPRLPQGVWQRDLKRADWAEVERLATEALRLPPRDLQCAAWLLEAWMHRHGFAGVRAGAELLHRLCAETWEELLPALDARDPEARSPPFHWINEKLSEALASLPITRPETGEEQAHSWADYQAALRREGLLASMEPRARQRAEGADEVTPERFAASVAHTPREFYAAMQRELHAAGTALEALQAVLDGRSGAHAPGLGRFRDTVSLLRSWAEGVLRERPEPALPPAPELMAAGEPVEPAGSAAATSAARGRGIASREEAYRLLADAAEYLRRTEPHSPTPLLVMRAVAWGSKPLPELLLELMNDGYDLNSLRTLLGIAEEAEAH